jgi:hypothetical protein
VKEEKQKVDLKYYWEELLKTPELKIEHAKLLPKMIQFSK